jgi:hypothetical protein
MTMQHESHPHDERLAALAAADAEATDDRALREHVATCDRCRSVIDDLRLLRSALAELPDLRPSRPLQLLPPVAAPATPRRGALGFLRRLSAPALAAGAALILVGTVGSTGILQGLGGLAGSPAMLQSDEDHLGAAEYGASDEGAQPSRAVSQLDGSRSFAPAASSGDTKAPAPAEPSAERDTNVGVPFDPLSGRGVWLLILGVGVALVGGALLLRFIVQPGAG